MNSALSNYNVSVSESCKNYLNPIKMHFPYNYHIKPFIFIFLQYKITKPLHSLISIIPFLLMSKIILIQNKHSLWCFWVLKRWSWQVDTCPVLGAAVLCYLNVVGGNVCKSYEPLLVKVTEGGRFLCMRVL